MNKTTFGAFLFLFSASLFAKQGHFVSSDGVSIFYTDTEEDKTPIVLMHGFTMDHAMWSQSEVKKKLAVDYRVITTDFRGHGRSDKPLGVSSYGPKVGLDVIALLNHLDLDKAHMLGYSMGAFVLGRLLVTHPKKIISATFCSGGFPIDSQEERAFQEMTAKHMEEDGNDVFASIAIGWAFDAVSEEQIEVIDVPMIAVFGSEELNDETKLLTRLITLPKSSQPLVVIDGADHDSEKAAVLHSEFATTVENFLGDIESGLIDR